MKIKITTTYEHEVDLSRLSSLTKKEMKKQLRKDIEILQNQLADNVMTEVAKAFDVKSPREHLNHLRASSAQDFDDALRDVLTDIELSKYNPFSVHR